MVDDDHSQLRMRQTILRSAGMDVHVATSVESALALLRAMGNKIGVVITDHCLPGRTGADLVRELRLTSPLTPVVVLSGMPGIEEEYDGLNVIIRMKPLPVEEFIRDVQGFLAAQKRVCRVANSVKNQEVLNDRTP
jgi:DNA-binding response OmpR family regulator